MGLEPTTSSLRVRRATHCATLPLNCFQNFFHEKTNNVFLPYRPVLWPVGVVYKSTCSQFSIHCFIYANWLYLIYLLKIIIEYVGLTYENNDCKGENVFVFVVYKFNWLMSCVADNCCWVTACNLFVCFTLYYPQ